MQKGSAWAASLTPGLVDELRHGGYVLVMRHASSPPNPPDKSAADPENVTLERQLDENGRMTAEAMGRAFKALHIPVGEIFLARPIVLGRRYVWQASVCPKRSWSWGTKAIAWRASQLRSLRMAQGSSR